MHIQFCQFCASLLFFRDYGLKCLDEQLKINNRVDTAIQYQTISSSTMSWSVGNTSEWPTIDAYFTLLPSRSRNYGRKWCKWWPGEAKTLYKGGLMRVWLTMDQNESRNNGTQVTDNIHSLHQMLVWEKKKPAVWLFGPLSCRSQGYGPPGRYKASS